MPGPALSFEKKPGLFVVEGVYLSQPNNPKSAYPTTPACEDVTKLIRMTASVCLSTVFCSAHRNIHLQNLDNLTYKEIL